MWNIWHSHISWSSSVDSVVSILGDWGKCVPLVMLGGNNKRKEGRKEKKGKKGQDRPTQESIPWQSESETIWWLFFRSEDWNETGISRIQGKRLTNGTQSKFWGKPNITKEPRRLRSNLRAVFTAKSYEKAW